MKKITIFLMLLFFSQFNLANEIKEINKQKINEMAEYLIKQGMILEQRNKEIIELENVLNTAILETKKVNEKIKNRKIETQKIKEEDFFITYVVKRGDNLTLIAKKTFVNKNNISIEELNKRIAEIKTLNNIGSDIHPLQKLKIKLYK